MVFLLVVSGAALNRDVPIERVKSRLRFRCRRIHPVGVDRDVQAQVSGIAVDGDARILGSHVERRLHPGVKQLHCRQRQAEGQPAPVREQATSDLSVPAPPT